MADDRAQQQRSARTVLLLRPTFHALEEIMSKRFHLLRAWESPLPLPEFLAAHAHDVQALLIRENCSISIDSELLSSLPNLKFIVINSVGMDCIDTAECARRGVAVANTGNVSTEDVAEYAVGLLIDVLRRISAADRYVRAGLWSLAGMYPLGSKEISNGMMMGIGKETNGLYLLEEEKRESNSTMSCQVS